MPLANVTVTAEFVKAYPIWIGYSDQYNPGVQVTAGDVLGDGTVIYTPDAEHPDTKGTLTLNGAKLFTGDSDVAPSGIMVGDGYLPFTELTIELVGENQIGKAPEAPNESSAYNVGYGISSDDSNVIFTGAGELTIYGVYTGISASSTSESEALSFGTVEKPFTGTVNIESYTPSDSYAAIMTNGGVTINGGTVNLTTKGGCGISAQGTDGIIINDGKVDVTTYYWGFLSTSGSVTITGGTVDVTAAGFGIESGLDVTISGDDTKVTAGGGMLGIGAPSVVISGGTVIATSQGGPGIQSGLDVTISGNNTKVTVDANAYGIASGTYFAISGGELSVTSNGNGIYAPDVVISGGKVDVTSNRREGIMATSNNVVISGGTVNATSNADGYNGIVAENGNVTISGDNTKVTATGENVGILAENVSITGGNVTGNGGIMAYCGALTITGGTVKAKSESAAIVGYGSPSGPHEDALTIGSEAAPLKIKNAMRMYLDGDNGFKDDEAITEAKGALALPVTDVDGLYVAALRALDNTGYVTIQPKQPAPSSGGSSTPTVTIPVVGDKDSVKVQATVSGSTAKIKNVTAEQLNKVGTGKEVTVDLSSLNKSVTGVTFPKTTLENIAESEASGLEVKLPGGTTAVFDKTTVAAIAEQAEGKDIKLVVDKDAKAEQSMTAAQKETLKTLNHPVVLDAYFVSGGKRISDFKGGEAELTATYPTENPVRVWYITDDGEKELIASTFDGKAATFVVTHFSHYVIEELDGSSYSTCPQDETCVYAKFTDADVTAWYHDGVHFCVENGYMLGVSDTKFAPSGTLSRAMIVTMLWRLEGEPVADYAMTFEDVKVDEWYTEAVRWAQSTGVVEGYSADSFGPDNAVTREQLAAILYRYAKYHEIDVANTNTLAGFTDVDKVSAWALDAMKWANAARLVQGRTTTTLVPEVSITRAEAATMVQRYCEAFKK